MSNSSKYYRSDEQVHELLGPVQKKPTRRKEVYDHVAKRHGLKRLGDLKGLKKLSIVVQAKGDSRKIGISQNESDMLVHTGAYDDAKLGRHVIVFGKLKKGKVVRCVAVKRKIVSDWLNLNT